MIVYRSWFRASRAPHPVMGAGKKSEGTCSRGEMARICGYFVHRHHGRCDKCGLDFASCLANDHAYLSSSM